MAPAGCHRRRCCSFMRRRLSAARVSPPRGYMTVELAVVETAGGARQMYRGRPSEAVSVWQLAEAA